MSRPPLPDAEAQCLELAALIKPHCLPETRLVGIHSGGAWVARRLSEILYLPDEPGLLDISFYRDDFGRRGLHPQVRPTSLPFDVENRALILVDDVLYTGRTTRAALNELFDYGRPASVRLAVLADRGGRELPFQPEFCVWRPALTAHEEIVLRRSADGRLQWEAKQHA